MIVLALLSPTAIVLAFVWFADRERSRATTSAVAAADRALATVRVQAETFAVQAQQAKEAAAAQLALTDELVRRHALHVDRLVQRIQAPEVAVAQNAAFDLNAPDRMFVGFDDDHAFQADRNEVVDDAVVPDWREFLADKANGH